MPEKPCFRSLSGAIDEVKLLLASARMYSVTPEVAAIWRRLFERLAERAGIALEVLDWPAPLPLAGLWAKPDKAAVFMCGLPFSLESPQPKLVAAPVPAISVVFMSL